MTRKPETIGFWRGRLPHWEVEDGRYFVTIHLAGAIPAQGIARIQRLSEELQNRPQNTCGASALPVMRTVFGEMERWLDRAQQHLLLNEDSVAKMVMEAIDHRVTNGTWIVYEFVIMPSHVHLIQSVLQGTLKDSLEDFKRWTGHQAGKLVELPKGRFWQDEWFDHWSRSDEQDERIVRYIRENPVKAGLVDKVEDWEYRM